MSNFNEEKETLNTHQTIMNDIAHRLKEHEARIKRLERDLSLFILSCPICGSLLERIEVYHDSPIAGLYKTTCGHASNIRVSVG